MVFCNVRTYNSGCGDGRGKLRFLRLQETLGLKRVVMRYMDQCQVRLVQDMSKVVLCNFIISRLS